MKRFAIAVILAALAPIGVGYLILCLMFAPLIAGAPESALWMAGDALLIGLRISLTVWIFLGLPMHFLLLKLRLVSLVAYLFAGIILGGFVDWILWPFTTPRVFCGIVFTCAGAISSVTFWLFARPTPPRIQQPAILNVSE